MSLFSLPRFSQLQYDAAPLFSLMNELAAASSRPGTTTERQTYRHFTPKFSVKENETNYELAGELPGVESKDVNIEFTSGNVLQISGRTESFHEEGTRPAIEAGSAIEVGSDSADQQETGSYHKAKVEDENAPTTSADSAQAEGTVATTSEAQPPAQASKEQPRYYFSERSVGEFARSFTFPPGSVKTDEVKASLKNGILSIIVPKASPPTSRRINVE